MNKFKDLMEDVRRRAESDRHLKQLLEDVQRVEGAGSAETVADSPFRMPYSTDPQPIDDRWK